MIMGKSIELQVELLERLTMIKLAESIQLKRVVKSLLDYIKEIGDEKNISYLYNENFIKEKTELSDLLTGQVNLLKKIGVPDVVKDGKKFEESHVLNVLSAATNAESNPFVTLLSSLEQSKLSDMLNVSTNFVGGESEPFYQSGGLDSDSWKLFMMEI